MIIGANAFVAHPRALSVDELKTLLMHVLRIVPPLTSLPLSLEAFMQAMLSEVFFNDFSAINIAEAGPRIVRRTVLSIAKTLLLLVLFITVQARRRHIPWLKVNAAFQLMPVLVKFLEEILGQHVVRAKP